MFPFPFSFFGGAADVPLELIDNNFAMEFDGTSSQYISIPSSGSLNTFHQNPFSVSFWFKTSSSAVQVLADKSTTSSGSTRAFYIYMQSGVIYWYGATGTGSYTNGSYSDGDWHHVACVAESDSVARIYVDGVDDTNNIARDRIGGLTVTAPITLGTNFTTTQFFLNGDMDEVAIWNKALELEDVQTIYNATNDNPGKCANLFTAGLGTDLVLWNRMGD